MSEYAFASAENRLAKPDFDSKFHDDIIVGVTGGHLVKHWNWILNTLQSLPEAIATKLVPQFEMLILEKKVLRPRMQAFLLSKWIVLLIFLLGCFRSR